MKYPPIYAKTVKTPCSVRFAEGLVPCEAVITVTAYGKDDRFFSWNQTAEYVSLSVNLNDWHNGSHIQGMRKDIRVGSELNQTADDASIIHALTAWLSDVCNLAEWIARTRVQNLLSEV